MVVVRKGWESCCGRRKIKRKNGDVLFLVLLLNVAIEYDKMKQKKQEQEAEEACGG